MKPRTLLLLSLIDYACWFLVGYKAGGALASVSWLVLLSCMIGGNLALVFGVPMISRKFDQAKADKHFAQFEEDFHE